MNAELSAICDRILSAVFNGGAQGLALLLLVELLHKIFPRGNAATRHAIGLATLSLLAVLPVAHFLFAPAAEQRTSYSEPRTALSSEVYAAPEIEVTANDPLSLSLPMFVGEVLVVSWFAIVVLRLGSLAWQCAVLRGLKNTGFSAPENVRELFSRLCVELKVSRAPQLRIAAGIAAPMVVGYRSPAVLLPEYLCGGVTGLRLEQILRHELAHVIRRDDWANLLQQTIRAVFFFHPGVVWLSRRLTTEREIACDDHVLSAIGGRKAYALSLTEFASRKRGRELIAAPAAWSSHSQLKQRISMILDTKRNASPRLSRGKAGILATAAILVAAIIFQAAPRLAFADPAEDAPGEPPESGPKVKAVIAPHPLIAPHSLPHAQPVPHAPHIAAAAAPAPLSALPGEAPQPAARPRRRAEANDDSIERRLERVERMVESLAKREAGNFHFKFDDQMKAGKLSEEDMARIHEKVGREVEKAAKEAEKAGKEAEKAMKELQKRGDFNAAIAGKAFSLESGKEGLQAQRRALEQQRQALEKQVQALERQIQRLERQQERLEHERDENEKRKERSRDEDKEKDDR